MGVGKGRKNILNKVLKLYWLLEYVQNTEETFIAVIGKDFSKPP